MLVILNKLNYSKWLPTERNNHARYFRVAHTQLPVWTLDFYLYAVSVHLIFLVVMLLYNPSSGQMSTTSAIYTKTEAAKQ
jgi:hypothetical protein